QPDVAIGPAHQPGRGLVVVDIAAARRIVLSVVPGLDDVLRRTGFSDLHPAGLLHLVVEVAGHLELRPALSAFGMHDGLEDAALDPFQAVAGPDRDTVEIAHGYRTVGVAIALRQGEVREIAERRAGHRHGGDV